MARFSSKEKSELANLVPNGGLVRVRGDVATCHMFGGNGYYWFCVEDEYSQYLTQSIFEYSTRAEGINHDVK